MMREIKYIPLDNFWVVFVLCNIERMWDPPFCLISKPWIIFLISPMFYRKVNLDLCRERK